MSLKKEKSQLNFEKKEAQKMAEVVFNRLESGDIETKNAKYSFEIYPAEVIVSKVIDFDETDPNASFFKSIMINRYKELQKEYITNKLQNFKETVTETIKTKKFVH